jgi:hypothetical protein
MSGFLVAANATGRMADDGNTPRSCEPGPTGSQDRTRERLVQKDEGGSLNQ